MNPRPAAVAIPQHTNKGGRVITRRAGGRARRAQPEAAIQRAVFAHIRARAAPGVFAFHPANGGYRKPVEAAIMKGLGVVAGIPDILAIRDGMVFALELKAEGRKASPKQLETIAAMERAGAYCSIADGLDRALQTLVVWGILKQEVR